MNEFNCYIPIKLSITGRLSDAQLDQLGETEEELFTAMEDLRASRCAILTLGQYLQPTLKHLPVVEFVSPERFEAYGERARQMGFVHVASGPMVRSSYHADEVSVR